MDQESRTTLENYKCCLKVCAEHNRQLCRSVDQKKVGSVDADGKTTWKCREVVTLTCPEGNLEIRKSDTVTGLPVSSDLVGASYKKL